MRICWFIICTHPLSAEWCMMGNQPSFVNLYLKLCLKFISHQGEGGSEFIPDSVHCPLHSLFPTHLGLHHVALSCSATIEKVREVSFLTLSLNASLPHSCLKASWGAQALYFEFYFRKKKNCYAELLISAFIIPIIMFVQRNGST